MGPTKTALALKRANFFDEVMSQTDRQIFQHHKWVCGFFLQFKFATSLLALLAGDYKDFKV